MQHVDYAYTVGMDDAETERRLAAAETGVLSLARDGEAYAIPVAHHYEDGRLYVRLGLTEGSRKGAFLETTETASYLLYGTEPTDEARELDSWSVLVTGTLRELPADERERFDTAEINRRFAPIRVFGEAIEDVEIAIFELEVETVAGRTTVEP